MEILLLFLSLLFFYFFFSLYRPILRRMQSTVSGPSSLALRSFSNYRNNSDQLHGSSANNVGGRNVNQTRLNASRYASEIPSNRTDADNSIGWRSYATSSGDLQPLDDGVTRQRPSGSMNFTENTKCNMSPSPSDLARRQNLHDAVLRQLQLATAQRRNGTTTTSAAAIASPVTTSEFMADIPTYDKRHGGGSLRGRPASTTQTYERCGDAQYDVGSLRGFRSTSASTSVPKHLPQNEHSTQWRLRAPLPQFQRLADGGSQSVCQPHTRSNSVLPWLTAENGEQYDDDDDDVWKQSTSGQRFSVQPSFATSGNRSVLSSTSIPRSDATLTRQPPIGLSTMRRYKSTTGIHLIGGGQMTSHSPSDSSRIAADNTRSLTMDAPGRAAASGERRQQIAGDGGNGSRPMVAGAGNVAALVNNFESIDLHNDQCTHSGKSNESSDQRRPSTSLLGCPRPWMARSFSELRSSSMLSLSVPTSTTTGHSPASTFTAKSSASGARNWSNNEDRKTSTDSATDRSRLPSVTLGQTHDRVGGSVGRAAGRSMISMATNDGRKLLTYRQFISNWQSRRPENSPHKIAAADITDDTRWRNGNEQGQDMLSGESKTNRENSGATKGCESARSSDCPRLASWAIRTRQPDLKSDHRVTSAYSVGAGSVSQHSGSGGRRRSRTDDDYNRTTTSRKDEDAESITSISSSQYSSKPTAWQRNGRSELAHSETGLWSAQCPDSMATAGTLLTPSSTAPSSSSTAFRLMRTGSLQSDGTGFDSGLGRSDTSASSTVGQ